ncbi:MAG: HNH endonuclease [Clostridiales Family XIII bacterium]|jgi:5-methylcytosine-specific restriction endonuclease McrA|nr:HNH endonuclease [Clostridiales Family XIII bacterium]
MGKKRQYRPDEHGEHQIAFKKNKRRIYATQNICGICGTPVDAALRFPHPMSKCVDHIIPVNRGGHPSDIDNLQLAHLSCNRQKSDKIKQEVKGPAENEGTLSNRILPQSRDWSQYRPEEK